MLVFGYWLLGTFEISKSEYVKEKYSFLSQSSPGALIPDVAAGGIYTRQI
ncbi:MAG: hypothetical protein R2822_29730 [Spirosomataceae bacterium]